MSRGPSLFLVSALSLLIPAPPRGADDTADLRALTEARFAANAGNDRAFYERLLAPNVIVLLPKHAPQAKAEYLAEEFGQRTGPSTGPRATLRDFRAQVDGDTAVVTYKEVEPTQVGDQVFEVRTERLDTDVRQRGEWRLLSMATVEEAMQAMTGQPKGSCSRRTPRPSSIAPTARSPGRCSSATPPARS